MKTRSTIICLASILALSGCAQDLGEYSVVEYNRLETMIQLFKDVGNEQAQIEMCEEIADLGFVDFAAGMAEFFPDMSGATVKVFYQTECE